MSSEEFKYFNMVQPKESCFFTKLHRDFLGPIAQFLTPASQVSEAAGLYRDISAHRNGESAH